MFIINYIFGDSNLSANTKYSASLASHCGMVLASEIFLLIENEGTGFDWSTITKEVQHYSIAGCMGMTIANIALFSVLTWYCE